MKAYYDRRATEYDDVYLGTGLFATRDRPGWHEDVALLENVVASLPPLRTLDVACGTGFLTRHLRGEIVGLDQSATMLELARKRVPAARFLQADALAHPFAAGAFERIFTSWFYCHLQEPERVRFLPEARRVARELVVVGSRLREGAEPVQIQERVLSDGSRWTVYKRLFEPDALVAELGGGRVLYSGSWFVVVQA